MHVQVDASPGAMSSEQFQMHKRHPAKSQTYSEQTDSSSRSAFAFTFFALGIPLALSSDFLLNGILKTSAHYR